MEYVFGTVRRNGRLVENLKTVGSEHTDLSRRVSVERKYPDNHITDSFFVEEKYRSAEDEEGNCYDWYVISSHNQYIDKFTPGISVYEQMITDLEIENIEQEQALTDAEIAIIELQEAIA